MVTTRASAPSRRSAAGWSRQRRHDRLGIAYATPAALVVGMFFLVPLGLVLWMSLHQWPLLGEPAINAPANYSRILDNALFVDAVWFTLKYTIIVTIVLFTAAFSLALLVHRPRPGVGTPSP